MTGKKSRRMLTLTGIVAAAAISFTGRSDILSKDNAYKNTGTEISLLKDQSQPELAYFLDMLDNTVDTLDAMRKDYRTLDSLTTEARNVVHKNNLVYHRSYIDSLSNSVMDSLVNAAVNRPKINSEGLVDVILDTVSTYTAVVSRDFIKASIREESRYDPEAKSVTGALGLMQFTKKAWKTFGEGSYSENVKDPEKNIRAGINFYLWMEDIFSKRYAKWDELDIGKKRDMLSAGFCDGPYLLMGKKVNWNVDAMPKQSRAHVKKVNAAMDEIYTDRLYLAIADYRAKIQRYESLRENTFWLAYDAANTGRFMNQYLFKS